ncbi:hypothetical protein NDN08_000075 [Rhodosorus marinus]|uniref:AGC-kinase C-terminal domain-containing protein n=1 Tax=Rhodosorus marinus TaxID=101924 RepID=A0AAV8UFH9_9RHOD|nr:hypothetical protein NDN08_000075 [Rhodosorus marinus]
MMADDDVGQDGSSRKPFSMKLRGVLSKGKSGAEGKEPQGAVEKWGGGRRLFWLKKGSSKREPDLRATSLCRFEKDSASPARDMSATEVDLCAEGHTPRGDKRKVFRQPLVGRRSLSNVQSGHSRTSSVSAEHMPQAHQPMTPDPGLEEMKGKRVWNWVLSPVNRPGKASSSLSDDDPAQPADLRDRVDPHEGFALPLTELLSAPSPVSSVAARSDSDAKDVDVGDLEGLHDGPASHGGTHDTHMFVGSGSKVHGTSMGVIGIRRLSADGAEIVDSFQPERRTVSVSNPHWDWLNIPVNPSARGESGDLASLSREASLRMKARSSQSVSRQSSLNDLNVKQTTPSLDGPSGSPSGVQASSRGREPQGRDSDSMTGQRQTTGAVMTKGSDRESGRSSQSAECDQGVDEYAEFISRRKKSPMSLLGAQKPASKEGAFPALKSFKAVSPLADADVEERLGNVYDEDDAEDDEYTPFDMIMTGGRP